MIRKVTILVEVPDQFALAEDISASKSNIEAEARRAVTSYIRNTVEQARLVLNVRAKESANVPS